MAWHASPGPLDTSFEYFYNQRQSENRQMIAANPDSPDWLTAGWVLKSTLAHIIVEDRVRGPFPLCHLDLHHGNMLFNEEYNLTGIIDWSSAQAAPLEQLSVCPELFTFPAAPAEVNRPIIEFKDLVLECLKEMERHQEQKLPLDNSDMDISVISKNTTYLSTYMASKSAEITYWQYMSSPRKGLPDGKIVAKLLYGENVTWKQLKEMYGSMPLC